MTGHGVYLAMDTSTPHGTVAVAAGAEVLARATLGRQGTHASTLVPAIASVLEDAGVDTHELSAILCGAGPGSFTGVRVAAGTAKGMAHALGIPVYAFNSLAVAAATVAPGEAGGPVWIFFDARGERVYAGCFRWSDGLEIVVEPHATTVSEVIEAPEAVPGAVFGGDGAHRHAARIEAVGHRVLPEPSGMPTADGLVRLFAASDAEPVEDAGRWEPEYLRATSAERAAGRDGPV